jgi:polysaccharide transporter, PST family
MDGEKKLFKNFIILGLSYTSNLLIPLLLMPHFIKVLGIGQYGIIALAQAFMGYLNILVEYHFSIITVKEISMNRNDTFWLNKTFNTVIFTRILLALFSFIILLIAIRFYPPFQRNTYVVFTSYFIVLGQSVLPNWFFQGIENMTAIAVLNFIFKIIFVILAYLFVNSTKDTYLPNFLLGLTNFVAGILGICYIFKKYDFSFFIPHWTEILYQLKMGKLMYMSNMSVSIYVTINPIILGLYCSPIIIGQYSIAERILGVIRSIISMFFQISYPRVAVIMKENINAIAIFYKKTFRSFLWLLIFFCVLFFIWAKFVLDYFFYISSPEVVENVRLLLGIAIIVFLNIPYYQRLLIANLAHVANYVYMVGGTISVILNFILVPIFGVYGSISTLYITEILVTTTLYYQASKYKLLK